MGSLWYTSAMFGIPKRQPPPPPPTIRDTLFGDVPMEAWPATVSPGMAEPWTSFVRARDAIKAGKTADAIAAWQSIADTPGLESRQYAQAWHFLRAAGVLPPPEKHKQLLGVVLEVTVENGLDLLAAYPERAARYYNFSGAGVVWEHPDASLDKEIDGLLAAGQKVLDLIGPWDKPRPPAPQPGQVRLNFISPAGLHFGQSTLQNFTNDAMAGPVLNAGVVLMQALIAKQATTKR